MAKRRIPKNLTAATKKPEPAEPVAPTDERSGDDVLDLRTGARAREPGSEFRSPAPAPEKAEAFGKVLHKAFASDPPHDMTKMTRTPSKKRSYRRFVLVVSIILAVSAAVTGFFVFTSAQRFTGQGVSVAVAAPETIASGGDVTITIRYDNREAVKLRDVQLAVTYPDGFTFTSASTDPTNEAKNAFAIEDLRPGFGDQLVIQGLLVGDVGASRTFIATLSYVPETFNSEFTTRGEAAVTLADSVLDVKFNGPERVVPDAEAEYTIVYTNQSKTRVDEARITLNNPDGFTLVSADPAVETDRTWTIRALDPYNSRTITIRGRFSGEVGTLRDLAVSAGLIGSDVTFKLQTEKHLLVQLIRPDLGLTLVVNGSSDDQTTLSGSALKYSLQYANRTDEQIADVEFRLTIEGPVDWDSLSSTHAPRRDGTVLIWTKAELADLAGIKPGGEGEITLSIRSSDPGSDAPSGGLSITSQAVISGNAPELGGTISASSDPLTVRISTVATLTTEARYYTDDFVKLGDGPIPPVVGSTTRYRIAWSLENTVNDVTGVTVNTTIPEDVFWTGRSVEASVGTLAFDATTRTVTWSLDRIPAGVGVKTGKLTATFDVSITPTASDAGKVMVLTDGAKFTGRDAFSSAELKNTRDALTTNCDADQYARGQGQVQSVSGSGNTNG